jgi:hypothetical protein
VLYPCKCDQNGITCGGTDSLNLKHVFQNIDQNLGQNEKHFKQFNLSNTVITEIEENTFFEVTFDEILIYNATNLKSINSHAFTSTNLVTKNFTLDNVPIVNSPPNYDVFLVLSSFINLEHLKLVGTKISEIPSYAFRPIIGVQTKLSGIDLRNNEIEKIGNYSFYDLKNLTFLSFYQNPLKLISMNSFNFKNFSNQTLSLYLDRINTLSGSSFTINSLSNIKRPTIIYLDRDPNLKFIDETIFLPFFESDPKNKIALFYANTMTIDCDDCRSHWLVKESKYLERFDKIECLNGNDIRNSNNFKNCK